MHFIVSVIKAPNWYVATCLESNVVSQGKNIDDALNNLQEALELFYEDDTMYLQSIPGMKESIMEGKATPLDECLDSVGWDID